MPDHDATYKLLFSQSPMVAALLRGFVREEWVAALDLSTLERVASSFVTGDRRRRESDMVWRVHSRARWVYVYLLLEFQSRS
ncbi:Rpn family recombination-promoting nuclease/putative transposase, partial [Pigmentiphaga soli]|uniref:Rpn family recombination-promoting nuclease/putative transposase n=1 Tax=Pigmentiphaga soli TaxID=1007095 RepID=UPI0031EEDAC6